MTEELTKRLCQEQIDAAKALYEKLEYWKRKNRILDSLKERDPSLADPDTTLLKVAAINQFYYTNLWAIDRMVDNILMLRIMSGLYNPEAKEQHADLVENIAILKNTETEDPQQVTKADHEGEVPEDPRQLSSPKKKKQKKQRLHVSFASKFAHFFISKVDFPLYDIYAVSMVNFHLPRAGKIVAQYKEEHPYKAFYDQLAELMHRTSLTSFEDVDRYLWLAGLCKEWKRSTYKAKAPKINQEVRNLFERGKEDQEIEQYLTDLFPYIPGKGNLWILPR